MLEPERLQNTMSLQSMSVSIGYIAQWLERLTADQQVPGSHPGVPYQLPWVAFQEVWNYIIDHQKTTIDIPCSPKKSSGRVAGRFVKALNSNILMVDATPRINWPAQNSNLESPAPEADALSIRPRGLLLLSGGAFKRLHKQGKK